MSEKSRTPLKIAIFCDYYLPGYRAGGPVKSISNIISSLGDEFDFKVITRDRDKRAELPYQGMIIDDWNKLATSEVYYVSPGFGSFLKMLLMVRSTEWHCIYFNSLFSLKFSFIPFLFCRLLGVRTLIAPRGELDDGALAVKPIKKRIFIRLVKLFRLYRRTNWHATSSAEIAAISSKINVPSASISCAPNLFSLPAEGVLHNVGESGVLRLVYVSRITPKKNLITALKALIDIKIPYSFEIYGPVDDPAYWRDCQKLIERVGAESITWVGEITPEKVGEIFRKNDLLVFPTYGENFGHVIVEALCNGCPVLISDMTPWNSIVESGAGYVVQADDIEAIRASIIQHLKAGSCERESMRRNARKYMQTYMDSVDLVQRHRRLFL